MKLLLCSEGTTNQSITNALLELLGKPFGKARAVHVPTAANGEISDKSWVEVQIERTRNLGFLSTEIIDISKQSREIWLPAFEKADVLVFGGGNDKYLLEWLDKSDVKNELPELLKTKVYVGLSAGSMVAASQVTLSITGMLYYERSKKWENTKGLGFVDFEIRPHLNSRDFPKVRLDYLEKLSRDNPTPFYALDDNSAVVVDGDSITVVSEGEWKKFN